MPGAGLGACQGVSSLQVETHLPTLLLLWLCGRRLLAWAAFKDSSCGRDVSNLHSKLRIRPSPCTHDVITHAGSAQKAACRCGRAASLAPGLVASWQRAASFLACSTSKASPSTGEHNSDTHCVGGGANRRHRAHNLPLRLGSAQNYQLKGTYPGIRKHTHRESKLTSLRRFQHPVAVGSPFLVARQALGVFESPQ